MSYSITDQKRFSSQWTFYLILFFFLLPVFAAALAFAIVITITLGVICACLMWRRKRGLQIRLGVSLTICKNGEKKALHDCGILRMLHKKCFIIIPQRNHTEPVLELSRRVSHAGVHHRSSARGVGFSQKIIAHQLWVLSPLCSTSRQ